MRVHYDRRGRIRGYSGGIGTYYWFQLLQIAFLLLIIIPVLFVLLAGALICVLGWGVATVLRKPSAAASWRSAASSTIGVAGRFGHWSDRQQGLETQPRAARHPTTPKPSAARQPTVTSGPTLYNVRCPNCSAALQSTASESVTCPKCGFHLWVRPNIRSTTVRSSKTTTTAPRPSTRKPSTSSELERLAKLHRSGELTDAEFAAAKARVLSQN